MGGTSMPYFAFSDTCLYLFCLREPSGWWILQRNWNASVSLGLFLKKNGLASASPYNFVPKLRKWAIFVLNFNPVFYWFFYIFKFAIHTHNTSTGLNHTPDFIKDLHSWNRSASGKYQSWECPNFSKKIRPPAWVLTNNLVHFSCCWIGYFEYNSS